VMTRTGADVDVREARHRRFALTPVHVERALVFLFLSVVILLRMNKGMDFGDQSSYYALFVDEPLKGGIDSSSYVDVHHPRRF
jgi:hypothetical protein